MKKYMFKIWNENKSFLIFITLMFIFRSAVADWNEVPTGSMNPTIVEGDRLLVNKMAYDIRVPFTHISLFKFADPERGDIIIFDSEASGKKLVKRVVGVPGDVVELKNNILFINDEELAYKTVGSSLTTLDKIENLLGVEHFVRINRKTSKQSNFRAITVPSSQYLVLGDSRDNSADSRVIGFVPRNEIVGRSKSVVLSFNYDNFYIPRKERFFHTL